MTSAVIAAIASVVGAAMTVLGTVLVRRAGRAVDDATAVRTAAEARATDFQTTSAVFDKIKAYLTEQIERQRSDSELRLAELRARHDEQLRNLEAKVTHMDERQQRQQAAIVAHMPWDADALAKLRVDDPAYPLWPPLDRP